MCIFKDVVLVCLVTTVYSIHVCRRAGTDPHDDDGGWEKVVKAVTGEDVAVRKSPDLDALRLELQKVLKSGIKSIAVVLKHSALFPEHEKMVGALAFDMGFEQISLSSEVMQMVKMVPRGFTAAADAYLTPHILRYVETFSSGFDSGLKNVPVYFMQSDGGLTDVGSFSGHKAILSGPAGGYVGYAITTKLYDPSSSQIIGFDMGGTSTDVSRYAGEYEHVFESTTAGVTIQAPQLDINTVAAGGGSRLFYESGIFRVGPESAGAHPGPVCYRKNGHLAITDANVVLGRVLPEYFPHIFGPHENEPLDVQGALQKMSEIQEQVNKHAADSNVPEKSVEEVAMGFIRVANEAMCRPIRALTQMRGYDITKHTLACFGGAGGQHACAIARNLGMKKIFVHKYSGVLSAVGIGLADVVSESQEPSAQYLCTETLDSLNSRLDVLEANCRGELRGKGFGDGDIKVQRFMNLRYDGTDVPIMTPCESHDSCEEEFKRCYEREFGFLISGRKIVVDDVRVRAVGQHGALSQHEVSSHLKTSKPEPVKHTKAFFEPLGVQDTSVFVLNDLSAGDTIEGPAIVIDDISTIVVEPSCRAVIMKDGSMMIYVEEVETSQTSADQEVTCDPIQLAVFSHRFMSIAEQMGRVLQRTSISVNIKERLDFSCALFDSEGNLVSNAPHLPVHLGAMSEAVKYQIKHYSAGGAGQSHPLAPGDVLISNHPQLAGGSHLPDITVMTPVFEQGRVVFFVASRGHHADIGGISPGSMPPNSHSLAEEGAAIVSFKLVRGGEFDEQGLEELLKLSGKSGIPGVVGTRNLDDNISDLRAQVAANNCGIKLVKDLIEEYSLSVVQSYMEFIQSNAEQAVRNMLSLFSEKMNLPEIGQVHAEDQMDDGTRICLAVTINRKEGTAIFDFTGTGPQVFGNTNAPPAVVQSAIIYILRAMIQKDIPLNHGCLAPVKVIIPPKSILNPSADAAVVGGNVLTSQRVTDVALSAFNAAAPSQGCMNNLTFGDSNMGYYETIAGGAGAGPGWHGQSGVHTHMTNTRITDTEILERRYPVVVKSFTLRQGSGGDGRWKGGDGVVRELEFLRPMTVSILSERRATAPPGLLGGLDGAKGYNIWIKKKDGVEVNLGGKASVHMQAGDRLKLASPGGAGYGPPASKDAFSISEEFKNILECVDSMYSLRQKNKGAASSNAQQPKDGGRVNEYIRQQHTA